MELAYDFMDEMREYPVAECAEPLLSLKEAVETAKVKVEFSNTKIAKKHDRQFYLRAGLIEKFIAVAAEMNSRGWILKVEDAYRSLEMQTDIGLQKFIFDLILNKVVWENHDEMPSTELMYRRFTAFIATSPKVGTHMSGSALDVSILTADDLVEIDRGGPYLEMSELTFMNSPFIPNQAVRNRQEINDVMKQHGFVAYPFEFWHFSQGDAYAEFLNNTGEPARYGAVNLDPPSGTISQLPDPRKPLHSLERIKKEMESAISATVKL